MSYEGYDEILCQNGHLHAYDCFDSPVRTQYGLEEHHVENALRILGRNPDRIDNVVSLLQQYWKKNPELRLGQILSNLACCVDLYFVEDDIIMKSLIEANKEDK